MAGCPFRKAPEYLLSEITGPLIGQLLVGFISVDRKRRSHSSDLVIVTNIQRFILMVIILPSVPGAHQRVLKNWELIGIVPHIIEELIYQLRCDIRPAKFDGTLNRFAALIAGQARD